jgi:osmotically-inducible protein OsmY
MRRLRDLFAGAAMLIAATSLGACKRASESGSAAETANAVGEDLKGVAKSTGKAVKDIGHATTDLADKAGKSIEGAAQQAGETGSDAWITTKVKSELSTNGFDPLHVHVDTEGKVVTLSGMVETAADARKAVDLAKGVKGVASVQDHLAVKPSR